MSLENFMESLQVSLFVLTDLLMNVTDSRHSQMLAEASDL